MRLYLPSGVSCDFDPGRARAARPGADAPPIARDVAILASPGVLRAVRDGGAVPLDDLGLADLHLLRVVLVQTEVVDEAAIEVRCENCDEVVSVSPSSRVELGPFRDDELDDPELDAPFDFDAEHPIPPLRVGRQRARTVRFARRTIAEARALWSRDTDQPLSVVPSIVAAMGIQALGEERRASVLARALSRASDAAWDDICALWEDANGHQRLVATVRCQACGANVVVAAPAVRELGSTGGATTNTRTARGATWDADAFERMVRRHAEVAYRRLRVRNIDLIIDEGVPAVDDGGEPLLGCYTPPHVDPDLAIDRPPEVRLFARSFRAEVEADPTFDLDGEVRETIEHELEHHLHFLSGHDPMDEEEREAIVHERRRQVGRRESARRGARALGADLVGFLRVGWPLLVIGAVAAWWGRCAG